MSAALAAYRLLAGLVGATIVPLGRMMAPLGSPARGLWGGTEGLEAVAGGPWIHAASMGEAVAARAWGTALLAGGYRPPLFVTTRTRTGLERVRRDWGERAVAALAPIDAPQAVRRVLQAVAPMRLDLIETELWPHLLAEAHRAGVPAVVVGATVSERTASRLRSFGLAGGDLFGPLFVLAQSERHAERYRSLGVAQERCRVIGDLKADALAPAAEATTASAPGARRLVVFASARPGEEEVAVAVARVLAARRDADAWSFVVAPRHDRAARAFAAAFARAGLAVDARDEASKDSAPPREWALGAGRGAAPGVGLLTTKGELNALFPLASVAIVGGTFAPWGGHNVLEPAAYGCAVVVGPHHGDVDAGVALLRTLGGGAVAADAGAAASMISAWLDDAHADAGAARRRGALEAVAASRGATRRGLDALAEWGLEP